MAKSVSRHSVPAPVLATWGVLLSGVLLIAVGVLTFAWNTSSQTQAREDNSLVELSRIGTVQVAESFRGPRNLSDIDPGWKESAIRTFEQWLSAIRLNPDIMGAALISSSGEELAHYPDSLTTQSLAPYLSLQGVVQQGELSLAGSEYPVRIVVLPVIGVSTPNTGCTLVMLAHPAQAGSVLIAIMLPAVAMLGVLLILVALFYNRLNQGTFKPLKEMGIPPGSLTEWNKVLPIQRNDEMGAVARNLDNLAQRTLRAEHQVEVLRKTIQSRVEAQTKQTQRELRRAKDEIWYDPLTRCYNRRFLQDKAEALVKMHADKDEDVCVVMIDVDHFKPLNDTLGHAVGDELLQFMGDLLRGTLRSSDYPIRMGGDEFVLILPELGAEEVVVVLKRVASLFNNWGNVLNVNPKPSFSIGLTSIQRSETSDLNLLLEHADEALYCVKETGRNDIQVWSPMCRTRKAASTGKA